MTTELFDTESQHVENGSFEVSTLSLLDPSNPIKIFSLAEAGTTFRNFRSELMQVADTGEITPEISLHYSEIHRLRYWNLSNMIDALNRNNQEKTDIPGSIDFPTNQSDAYKRLQAVKLSNPKDAVRVGKWILMNGLVITQRSAVNGVLAMNEDEQPDLRLSSNDLVNVDPMIDMLEKLQSAGYQGNIDFEYDPTHSQLTVDLNKPHYTIEKWQATLAVLKEHFPTLNIGEEIDVTQLLRSGIFCELNTKYMGQVEDFVVETMLKNIGRVCSISINPTNHLQPSKYGHLPLNIEYLDYLKALIERIKGRIGETPIKLILETFPGDIAHIMKDKELLKGIASIIQLANK